MELKIMATIPYETALTAAAFSWELLVARDEKAYAHSMDKDWPPFTVTTILAHQ
jgi:hypothetical protein